MSFFSGGGRKCITSEQMTDRGDNAADDDDDDVVGTRNNNNYYNALHYHLGPNCTKMDIRQTRRGWIQEMFLGWDARTEFKYYSNNNNNNNPSNSNNDNTYQQQFAYSLEDSHCLCRLCCNGMHPFYMSIEEIHTNKNILTLYRPLRCHASSVKCCCCCCYQEGIVTTTDNNNIAQLLGTIRERCYICVPEYHIYDDKGNGIYRLHPPTCCCGLFVNVCAEGIPCWWWFCCCCGCGGNVNGFWKIPFHLFPYHQYHTDNAYYIGKIVKKPKSLLTELFTNANAFEIDFPTNATAEEKGLIVGAAILLNAIYFEEKYHNKNKQQQENYDHHQQQQIIHDDSTIFGFMNANNAAW